jgi:hypothetical protein
MEDRMQNNKNEPDEDKLFVKRAYKALPVLVRQTRAGRPITYGNLAQEIGMPNPRNLGKVLGYIGEKLIELGKENNKDIPPINCLVINKDTGLPGEGIGWFLSKEDFSQLTRSRKQKIVNQHLASIFAFRDWYWVLEQLHLEPLTPSVEVKQVVAKARAYQGGPESPAHKAFKEFIAQTPGAIGLKASLGKGQIEYPLPSQDKIDVVFVDGELKIGIEVKSKISDTADIVRGLFQCVKYKYLLEAEQAVNGDIPNCRVILVLENRFPAELVSIKNILGVEVIDEIVFVKK